MKLGRAPLLVLLCFAFARPSAAQDWKGQGRVEGKVTDTKGQPLEGVAIKLTLPGRGGTQVKTDKKGHWAIMGLAGGEWDIDYTVQGYQPKRISARFSEASSNSPVEVKLEMVPGPPAEVMAALDAGDAAYKAGNYAEARAQYEKLLTNETITSRPDVVRTLHMQIAHCYSQEKNTAKEMEHLQAVLDADPTNVDIKKLMALEALQGGMFEKGAEMLKALPESSMQDPDVLFNVGVAFFNNQKVDEAIDWWTRTLKANPSYADAYYWRANAYLSQNKLPEAKADYQKFLESSSTNGLSMDKYSQLAEGISFGKAAQILGGAGEETARSGDSVVYTWKNAGGCVLTATFRADKLISKAQTGLADDTCQDGRVASVKKVLDQLK